MSLDVAMALGALAGVVVVAVVLIWYVEKRLKDLAYHLEELYAQLEALLWRLEE